MKIDNYEVALNERDKCEEVLNSIGTLLLKCSRETVGVVFHKRDNRDYAMCHCCLSHNVRNRGGELKFIKEGYKI